MSEQDTQVMAMLQKMQQQLVYLEKKLDTLIQQSQQSRPFRPPFGRPNRPHQGHNAGHTPQSHASSQGSGSAPGQSYKKPFYGRGRDR